ncbi:MAG: enoyl-CoA hydratase/isomerase family protein [bacterium]
MQHLRLDRSGPVAVMTWNHEEQNRFTTPFLEEVCEAWEGLAEDDEVRGVVVTAAQERYWSTGLHLPWLLAEAAGDPSRVAAFLELLHRVMLLAVGFPKPLVAAINGHAIGGGAILAACCDYRLMRDDVGFVAVPAVKLSIPFSPGVVALLRDILPPASFRTLAYTGERVTSAEAHELGFVDELLPPGELLPMAVALAAKLGAAKSATYAAIKRELRRHVLHVMRHDDPPALKRTLAAVTGQP